MKYYSLVTREQSKELMKLGCNLLKVDEVINWLRTHNIIIYDAIEPFVETRLNVEEKRILYRIAVKRCNIFRGYNARVHIGSSNLTYDINEAKRQCIDIAINWIKENPKCF